jgi:predicted TPR repeat methyltransferase
LPYNDDESPQNDLKKATKALFWRQCVEDLYDGYAKTYEVHLQKALGYTAPDIIKDALVKFQGARLPDDPTPIPMSWSIALDIGAGTGLMGVKLREHCLGKMIACDLSRKMLAVATSKVRGMIFVQ